jgi:hypothetical protein
MSLSTGQCPPPQTRRLRKTVPENRRRSLTIAIADFCNKIGPSRTWQGIRTKAAFSPGADILALVRAEPVYGFTASDEQGSMNNPSPTGLLPEAVPVRELESGRFGQLHLGNVG